MSKDGRIIKILKKYAIILISLEFLTRWGGVIEILRLFQSIYQLENVADIQGLNNLIIGLSTFVLNLIVGIILLFDLNMRLIWTWILFCWTLLNPWTSIVFFLLWKILEINETKHNNGL